MEKIKLSPRLRLIASLVPQGARAADIGTDHGYIPVWLVQSGVCERVTASDIVIGPLECARRSSAQYGVTESIDFVLSDGLDGCRAGETDTVIIAGMGGDTISGILERAEWTKDGVLLLLQPMSKAERLRLWLWENGYKITAERLVRDSGKIYPVICAEGGIERELTDCAELLTGKYEQVCSEPLFAEYLDRLISRTETAVRALRLSEKDGDGERLIQFENKLEGLLKMRRRSNG